MKHLILTGLLLGLAQPALAQSKISAQSIIVNPVETELKAELSANRPAGASYRAGEDIQLSVRVNQDAYVYLFNVDARGQVDLILPNRIEAGSNFVKAGTVRQFPEAGARFRFTVDEPAGINKVLALASTEPLNIEQIAQFKSESSFARVQATGQDGLARALSIIVNPVPATTWTSAAYTYQVTPRQVISTGMLFVGSNAPGTVILNGQTLGASNTTYSNLRPGTYPVRVKATGYADYATTVRIEAGKTTNLNVDFVTSAPVVSSGNPFTDLLRNLLGTISWNDPVRAAFDQQSQTLRQDGWTLRSQSAVSGGWKGTFSGPEGQATLTVTQGAGRSVNVKIERSSTYSY